MTITDAVSGAAVPGYKFIGQTKDGLWGKFVEDDGQDWTERQRQECRQEQELLRRQRAAEEAKRRAEALPALERDRLYRNLLNQLTLHPADRADLKRRGLSDEQIEQGGFKSTEQWQRLKTELPHQLPGVNLDGLSLNTQPGYLCPIKDADGMIVGCQVRLRNAGEGGRYRWLTSATKNCRNGATSHLPNGELPLAVHRSGEIELTSIGMVEGTAAKPFIASQRLKQVTIGASGGQFCTSPQTLKSTLEKLSLELDTRTVDLYPDAGAIFNGNLMGHYERALRMISGWGYTPRVAWWGQWTKEQLDIDELPNFDEIAYLTPSEFLDLGKHSQPTTHNFTDLFGIVPRLKRLFEKQRRSPWGFGRKDELEVEPSPAAPETLKYDPGDRHNIWQAAYHLGYRHILDVSPTGAGKSFDAGLLTPEMFDARQIIYVSKEHRNPTTATLKGWHDLQGRHSGLYRDEFGRLRRVNKHQPYVVPPNCGRNETIAALRAKNIHGADTASLICKTCPNYEPCQAGAGAYDFLAGRREALQQPRLRAHPDSLPSPQEYSYDRVVLLWEESGETIKVHRSTEVKVADVDRAIAILLGKLPETFDALRPLLTTLHQHLSGEIKQPNKYGWSDHQIRQALPQVDEIDLDAVRLALTPDARHILDTTQEHGVDVADLPRQIRKKFTPTDQSTAEQISNELALDWLPDLLDILLGNQVGSLRIQYGVLTMTLGDRRLAEIANAASCNIYLDATASPSDITRSLKLEDERQLLVIQQATQNINNLEVIQITGLGRLGLSQRSDYCTERVDAVINQIKQEATGKVAVVDFKRHSASGERHWWVDSRGSNDLEDCDTLAIVGTPCRNLSELEAEFTILYGHSPQGGTERVKYPIQINGQPSADLQPWFEMEISADPEFRDFVRRRILADIHQCFGRMRAHRRPEKQLKIFFIADYPLDIPVTLKKASDITPEAASKIERVEIAIRGAVQQLKQAGQKVTQQAIASLAGLTQGYISRFRKLLQTLLDDSYSKSNNFDGSPEELEFAQDTAKIVTSLADDPPLALLESVNDIFFAWLRPSQWRRVWDFIPAEAQIKIMVSLALALPQNQLQELATY
jgi:hypothetical protein